MVEVRDFIGEEIVSGKTFVTVKIKDEADEVAFRAIAYSKPAFVPPMTLSEENDEQIFSFDITAERFIKLSMLPNSMLPLEFLIFMKNLTQAVITCDDYFMNPLNFLILEDYIYVNPKNYDVRLIYAPFFEPVFSEADIGNYIFKISRRFAKTTGDGWQEIITRLWNMSESTSVYEASELFNALYDEHNSKEHVSDDVQAAHTSYGTERRIKSDNIIKETDRVPAYRDDPVDSSILREPEVGKKKIGFFNLNVKKDAKKEHSDKQAKKQLKEQPKKQEKVGMFSNQVNEDKHIVITSDDANEPLKETKGFFSGGHKAEHAKPQRYAETSWSQSSVNDDTTQPPPGFSEQYDSDITQPPAGYQNISSARFDFCGDKNTQNLPETIRLEFRDGVFMIGRVKSGKNTCDFAFPDATGGVSHLHARITKKDGSYFITDMNTRYGTYVGFHKIAPMKEIELNDDETVSFSMGVDYRFHIERGR